MQIELTSIVFFPYLESYIKLIATILQGVLGGSEGGLLFALIPLPQYSIYRDYLACDECYCQNTFCGT